MYVFVVVLMCYYVSESNGQLLKDLKSLKLVLNHFESNSTITTTALKTPQVTETNQTNFFINGPPCSTIEVSLVSGVMIIDN